ncbi:MAG TPA: hypothetical protein VFZ44_10105 [Pyrinomonadaceae bacterium]
MDDLTRCQLCGTPDFTVVTTCKRCGAARRTGFEPGPAAEASRAEEPGERPRPRPAPRAVPTKECPTCLAPCAASAGSCPHCGHRFPGLRARYVVVPLVMVLVMALFAAVRYFDEKAKETRLRNMRAGIGVPYNFVDPTTGVVETEVRPTPQKPWFSSWFRSKPTADEIFAHNLEVSGGAEAIARIKSHRSKGTLTFSAGMTPGAYYYGGSQLPPPARFVTHSKAPDKILTELEIGAGAAPFEQGRTVRRGFDGRRGWEYVERYVHEQGSARPVKQAELREFEGAELEQVKRYAGAGSLVRLAEQYGSLVMLDNQKVSQPRYYGVKEFDRECYVVRGLNRENKLETFYFDIDTGLLMRFDFEAQGPDGPTTIEAYPEDYKEVEKVMLPFSLAFKADGIWMTVTFNEFKLNATILDSAFEPPAS